jgi:Integrase core domain
MFRTPTGRPVASSACAICASVLTGLEQTPKAERFIKTLTNEWAHGRIYGSSAERAEALALWLDRYNFRRPHGCLGHRPPATRVKDLVGNYS